jgi:hypothetical protein
MTRKDYETIAAAFRRAYGSIEPDYQPETRANMRHGIDRALGAIAEALGQENKLFDYSKFVDACRGV